MSVTFLLRPISTPFGPSGSSPAFQAAWWHQAWPSELQERATAPGKSCDIAFPGAWWHHPILHRPCVTSLPDGTKAVWTYLIFPWENYPWQRNHLQSIQSGHITVTTNTLTALSQRLHGLIAITLRVKAILDICFWGPTKWASESECFPSTKLNNFFDDMKSHFPQVACARKSGPQAEFGLIGGISPKHRVSLTVVVWCRSFICGNHQPTNQQKLDLRAQQGNLRKMFGFHREISLSITAF